MSLVLLDNILLRSLSDPVLTAKGSELTWDEEDTNFVILHDAIKELSAVAVSGIDAYIGGTEYSLGDFVTYNNNTWEFINVVPQTGVTPGTNPSIWQIASQGLFSHQQNTDTYLNFGGVNQVSAVDLKALVDAGVFDDSGLLPLDGSRSMTGDVVFADTKGLTWASGSSIKDQSGTLTFISASGSDLQYDSGSSINFNTTDPGSSIGFNSGGSIAIHANGGYIDLIGTGINATTVPYLNSSKQLVSSAVTPTQLGYVDATSSIQTQLNAKQATLVSGTNIKTINGTSLLGSGDITISGAVSDGDKGDITVSSSGTVWSIDAGVVTNTMLAGSIAYSKLSLTGAILNADLAGSIDLTTKVTGILPGTNGGTGVNNSTRTLTYAGNVAFTGAFNLTIAVPQTTTYTLPNTASETLAGLGTAQTFTAKQTFTAATTEATALTLLDTTYKVALEVSAANTLRLGNGFTALSITKSTTFSLGVLFSSDLSMGGSTAIISGTTNGLTIFKATNQKGAFWGATPVIQQTTGSAAATFVANTSGIVNDTATFDGYTLGQVVKILRTLGLLA